MFTINKKYLPLKIHYFLFNASMGPIILQSILVGKEIGVGAHVIGMIISILPVFYLFASLLLGYLSDRFTQLRRFIFMSVILLSCLCSGSIYFVPKTQQAPTTTILSLSEMNGNFSNYSNLIEDDQFQYNSFQFYMFAFALCSGIVFCQATTAISDAISFDVLGADKLKFGYQRAWGAVGFGLSGLLGGLLIDYYSTEFVKNITPTILITITLGFGCFLNAIQFKLPKLRKNETIINDVFYLLKQSNVVIFLLFAFVTGIIESWNYFVFWHLEEVAQGRGDMSSIKLIEGCVLIAKCSFDIILMSISGIIIQNFGYDHSFSLALLAFTLRYACISMLTNPWYLILIDTPLRGLSTSLTEISIAAYASSISPHGTSTIVQGLVFGTYDGMGTFFGASFGGHVYRTFKGKLSFRFYSIFTFIICIAHVILRFSHKHESKNQDLSEYVTPVEQHKIKVISNSNVDV